MTTNGLREGKDGLGNGGGPQWLPGNKLGPRPHMAMGCAGPLIGPQPWQELQSH